MNNLLTLQLTIIRFKKRLFEEIDEKQQGPKGQDSDTLRVLRNDRLKYPKSTTKSLKSREPKFNNQTRWQTGSEREEHI